MNIRMCSKCQRKLIKQNITGKPNRLQKLKLYYIDNKYNTEDEGREVYKRVLEKLKHISS